MNKSLNNNLGELNPVLLNDLLIKFSKETEITKWDMGASSSRDISVQVQQGNAKQLKGSQRNSMTLRVWNNNKVGIDTPSFDDYMEKRFFWLSGLFRNRTIH